MGSKEIFLRMREADYNDLPARIRNLFTYVEVREENEYDIHKDDHMYKVLYKEKRTAAKAVQDYLYDKRHGGK